jgi:ATP-dependent RNA helicase DeaD
LSFYKRTAEALLEEFDQVSVLAAAIKLMTKEPNQTPVNLTDEAPMYAKRGGKRSSSSSSNRNRRDGQRPHSKSNNKRSYGQQGGKPNSNNKRRYSNSSSSN